MTSRTSLALLAILSAHPSPAAEPALAGRKPNVILIMTDDQGYGDLACHGNPHIKTPNLDRLHRESVRFTDFHVSPTCAPTRSALMTGRHEFKNGVTHTINERERMTLTATTLPQVLKRAGYTTGIFGKWHLGDEDAYQPGRRGFDEVFIHGAGGIGQSYVGSCGDAPGNKYFDPCIRHNGVFEKTAGYCTDVFFGQAAKWIEQVKGKQPFFAYITPNAPHAPLDCPPGSDAPYRGKVPPNVAKFYGMIANVDENVGKLLERIKTLGIENDTLVIFQTDNGTATGASVFNAGMRGSKNTHYSGGTRVPAFWRWPGTLPAGTDVAPLTCHWDILPTLAEMAGQKLDGDLAKQVEGRSLVPLLKDAKATWANRYFVRHIGRWPAGKAAQSQHANASIRDERWQLVFSGPNRRELFDLKADPGEKTNVIDKHPAEAARLSAEFDRWWASVLPHLENENAPKPAMNPYKEAYWKQFGGPGPNNVPPPGGKPNVLFIVTDDQRWDTIAALGNPEINTPNLDNLVARGFTFRNAYCMGSMIGAVCAPSRTMLMTGKSLWRIPNPRVTSWDGPTLGGVFRKAGYDTLFVGKRGNTFIPGNKAFEKVVYDDDRPDKANRAGSSKFHADTAIEWLKDRKPGTPFLLYFAPPVPHDPRQAPAEFMNMYSPDRVTLSKNFMPMHPFDNGELKVRDEMLAPHPRTEAAMKEHLAAYYACVSNLDRQVGRVIEELNSSSRLDNTVVIFTSDQGLAVGGRHGLMGKQNLYEHVKPPLVLAGPGIPRGGSDALVYLFDLLPTLCDRAGLAIPDGVEGKSLMPVIAGNQSKVRDTLFGAYRDCQRMIRDDRWKLIAYNAGGVRNTQLFDLRNDPDEIDNLAEKSDHAGQRRRMERLLDESRRSFGDPVGE